jgi:cationic peptide transport system substrate-binding protein
MRLCFCFIVALCLTGCYQSESSITDSLVYCPESLPQTLNPQISSDIATLDATTHQLYNRLVKIDPTTKHFIGDLASNWFISKDKTKYTFFLQKNVPFHHTDYFTPSRNLNADDVIFSLKRILLQDHPFNSVNSDVNVYVSNLPLARLITDIIKIDDYSLQIILNEPDVSLLPNLAAHYSVIHSKEYAQQLISLATLEKIDYYPIGTGPYKFKNRKNPGIIRFIAHEQYWQQNSAIQSLIFDTTENKTKRYTKLLSGECDIITNPAPSQLTKMSENNKISISSKPTSNVSLWAFNSKHPPFDQRVVRQAFSYAVNQQTILEAVFFQSATATNTLLAKQSWAQNLRSFDLKHEPQTALKLLHDSNFDFNKVISILLPSQNSVHNPNYYETAELIQANLLEIGIKSEIISLPQSQLEQRLLTGEYDTYLTGINSQMNDPDSLFRPLFSCYVNVLEGNAAQWCSEEVQLLLDAAQLESNFMSRIRRYYQIQQIIQKERPYYPIAHVLRIDAFTNNISGLIVNPLTGINFKNVLKKEVQ